MEKPPSHHQVNENSNSELSMKSQEQNNNAVSIDDNTPPKLTLKQRRFVEVTAKTLNGTEAASQVYDVGKNRALAHTIASENMRKPAVKKALERAMSTNKQDRDILQEAYSAPRQDKISYGELHRYWRTALELKGKLGQNSGNTVNIGIVVDKS